MTMEPDQRSGRRTRIAVLAGIALVALAVLGVALAAGPARFVITGDTYPGTPTAVAQMLGHFAATLAAAVCFGGLVYIVTTAVPDDTGRIDPSTFRIHLLVERTALAWVVLTIAMVATEAAARAGAPVIPVLTNAVLGDAVGASQTARGWCAAAVFAAVVAIGVRCTLRWTGHVLLLIPAMLGVIAVPVTGNAGQGPDHDVATSAVIVFAVGLAVLTGIKIAAVVSPAGPAVRRRVTVLQSAAGLVTVLYGAILAPLMTAGTSLLGSMYGRLLLTGAVLLLLVVLADVISLRWPDHRGTGNVLTAASTIGIIGVVGAVAAMAVQVPPRFLVHPSTSWDVFLGYELPGPANIANLATVWRFDPFLGTGAVLLGLAYVIGVVRLRRRGDRWPVGRTIAWISGCTVLLVATSSGVRAYGSAMFSVHMADHMALNMFIPVVLVLGAPITLALRALPTAAKGQPPGPREWLLWMVHAPVTRFISHPVTAFMIFVGSLYAVYFTPLFDTLVRYHWGHEFMSVHFLITGYLFYWGIIGIDPGPKRLPFLGRLGLLFAVMPFHAFFGIATMTMTSAIGGNFYRSLGLPWVTNISDDQHLGGAIAWGSSELPVVIVVIALVAQWARQDRRAGARQDRHSDSGYDDELDAYNAMLAELARNRR